MLRHAWAEEPCSSVAVVSFEPRVGWLSKFFPLDGCEQEYPEYALTSWSGNSNQQQFVKVDITNYLNVLYFDDYIQRKSVYVINMCVFAKENWNRCKKKKTLWFSQNWTVTAYSLESFVCLFRGEERKRRLSMELLLFELETAKAQETLTNKYLASLSLTYLGFALDTMSTNASSVLHAGPFPLGPGGFFHVFIKASVFWADIWVRRVGLHSLSTESLLTQASENDPQHSAVLKICVNAF